MSIKITVPWLNRIRSEESRSARRRNGWTRIFRHEQALSPPLRSVTMQEDDLDHLGALHQVIEHRKKR